MGKNEKVATGLVSHSIKIRKSSKVLPIGRLTQVPVEIEGLRTYTYFEVIDISNHTDRYLALLGID